jgi:hypothetical protein
VVHLYRAVEGIERLALQISFFFTLKQNSIYVRNCLKRALSCLASVVERGFLRGGPSNSPFQIASEKINYD